ncbi:unnamed protein product [Amoebophrya sp. A25]|nr:unnamed protein product [Amoebophrya sp. A25]|eukprot:GSA25T00021411001.1
MRLAAKKLRVSQARPSWASRAYSCTAKHAVAPEQPAIMQVSADKPEPWTVNPRYRRAHQADAVWRFLQLAGEIAPEFEFYVLPKHSRFPLIVRRRGSEKRSPLDGLWSMLQIRSTWRASEKAAKTTGGVWYCARNGAYETMPQVPNVVFCTFSSSCFVFSGDSLGTCLLTKPGSANEIDLSRSADQLRQWLQEAYPTQINASISGTLESLMLRAATTKAIVTQRRLLVQALHLPVLQEWSFHTGSVRGATDYHATLAGRRILVRAPENRSGSPTSLFQKTRLYYDTVIRGTGSAWRQPIGVDYLLLMLCSANSTATLTGIGVLPMALLKRRQGTGKTSRRLTSRKLMLLLENGAIIGGDFEGLEDYFYFLSKREVSASGQVDEAQRPEEEEDFHTFIYRIFDEWDGDEKTAGLSDGSFDFNTKLGLTEAERRMS